MFGSEILEVAIGLVFVFLIASLLATAMREGIEQVLKTRAIHLEKGIRQLLQDETWTGATQAVFEHPQIFSLFRGEYRPDTWWKLGSSMPAYIPSRNFAVALLHTVAGAKDGATLTFDNVRAGIGALPDGRLRQALEAAIGEAQGDLERARAGVEAWFDSGMDRVSGWYKRESQWILFLLGVGLAVTLNINALTAGRELATNNNMRLAVVNQAQQYLKDNPTLPAAADQKLQVQMTGLSNLVGWGQAKKEQAALVAKYRAEGAPTPSCERTTGDAKAACVTGKLERQAFFAVWPKYVTPTAVLGWLITATAISLGAPFWFDLLNKLMVIRSTVKPNEKSPPEGSKDRAGTPPASPPPPPVQEATGDGGVAPVGAPRPGDPPFRLRLAFDDKAFDPGTLTVSLDGGDGTPVDSDNFVELPLRVGFANQIAASATLKGKAVNWSQAVTPGANAPDDTLLAILK